MTQSILRSVYGAACIVLAASAIGLASNALRPDGLPLVRKPLRETRAYATKKQLLQVPLKPVVAKSPSTTKLPSTTPPKIRDAGTIPVITAHADPADRPIIEPAVRKTRSTVQSKVPAPHPVATAESPASKVEALFTTLEDAKSVFDSKAAIFLDSRPIEDYEAEHISGALSLYCENFDELYTKVLEAFPKDKIIVTFCSDPECKEAIKLADALVARGHTKVVILLEGLPGWKDAGYPTTNGREP